MKTYLFPAPLQQTSKIALILFSALGAATVWGCNGEDEKVVEYDLTSKIQAIVSSISKVDSSQVLKLNFDTLAEGSWDSALVIKPYSPLSFVDQLNLTNIKSIEPFLELISMGDYMNGLVFIKDRKITRYSKINRSPIDFCYLQFGDSDQIAVITQANKDDLYLVVAGKTDAVNCKVIFREKGF